MKTKNTDNSVRYEPVMLFEVTLQTCCELYKMFSFLFTTVNKS